MGNATPRVEFSSPETGHYRLSGTLTLDTVARLFEQWPRLETTSDEAVVTFDDMERVDSGGLALLLEWQARARQRGGRIRLVRPPSDLVRLAHLCEADEALGLEHPDDA